MQKIEKHLICDRCGQDIIVEDYSDKTITANSFSKVSLISKPDFVEYFDLCKLCFDDVYVFVKSQRKENEK